MTVEAEVPPNASARVFLPHSDTGPVEVGSGRYRWSYPYQEHEAPRPLLSLDSTLDDLLDDPEAYALVMKIMTEHNAEFADRMNGQIGLTLRQFAYFNPHAEELCARIEIALASLGR